MKLRHMVYLGVFFHLQAMADSELPPTIAQGILQSSTGESGGFGIKGVDEKEFQDYIGKHWREIAANIESLPKKEGNNAPQNGRSVLMFAAACEVLPPEEYVDFLDTMLDLYEQKRISFWPIDRFLGGLEQKDAFLEVNWEHPRVKAIFEKTKRLTPPEEEQFLGWLESAASGELADNYKTNMPDDMPLPQTLPGIKLQRPWASLIKKYEELTGEKVPPDPEFDPRPEHRGASNVSGTAEIPKPGTPWILQAIVALVVVIVAVFGIWKYRSNAKASV